MPSQDLELRNHLNRCKELITDIIQVDPDIIDLLMLPVICGGNALIHSMIGTGKTAIVIALARTLDLESKVYQCHPETMPSDLEGYEWVNPTTRCVEIRKGPLLTAQVLLMDEINRMSPRSQAALLGPMAQGFVTIGGSQINVAIPFIVFATQNPIESQGVYPLAEAQLDRFMLQIRFPAHKFEAITKIMEYRNAADTMKAINTISPVLSQDQLTEIRESVNHTPLGDTWKCAAAVYYACIPIHQLNGRAPEGWERFKFADQCVLWGPSPRALISLAQSFRGLSYLKGRHVDLQKDESAIKAVAKAALRHRIILSRNLPLDYQKQPYIDRVDRFLDEAIEHGLNKWKSLPDLAVK